MFVDLDTSHPFSLSSLDPPETKRSSQDPWLSAAARASASRFIARKLPPPNAAQYFRHSGWDRTRARVYQSLQRTGRSSSRIDNFSDCGSHAYVLRNPEQPTEYRLAGSTCHDRFCVPCSTSRSRTISANVIEALNGKRARFLTLTTSRGDTSLTDALDHLYKSFASLRKLSWWKKRVTGGVAFCEIKYVSSNHRWNVHLHALVTGTYVPQRELASRWHRVTGDSYIVDIRCCSSHEAITRYVCKYASKPLNTSYSTNDELLDEAVSSLTGRRLALTFGTFRGLGLTDHTSEDAWDNLGSLDDLLRQAADGDTSVISILRQLDANALTNTLSKHTFPPRGPPLPLVVRTPDPQHLLIHAYPYYL